MKKIVVKTKPSPQTEANIAFKAEATGFTVDTSKKGAKNGK